MNMRYTISQMVDLLFDEVNTVHGIFNSFFGEEYVDLQNADTRKCIQKSLDGTLTSKCNLKPIVEEDNTYYEVSDDDIAKLKEEYQKRQSIIYVWFSWVTVTNEHGRSVNIQDLYAKIAVQLDGRIPYEQYGFKLNRATYTADQFHSNYMHSHCSEIPKTDFTQFMTPCLGMGPIKDTILTLKTEYDEASWMLFCQELGMYVTVESLNGGPYHKLENIASIDKYTVPVNYSLSRSCLSFDRCGFTTQTYKDFVQYYLTHGHLSLMYKGDRFQCGMPCSEFLIDISNAFIDFYNSNLAKTHGSTGTCFTNELLLEVDVVDGKFYEKRMSGNAVITSSLDSYRDKLVLIFKGKEIRTAIIEKAVKEKEIRSVILNPSFALYVLNDILKIINFRFENGNNKQTNTASPYQRVCYL